MIFLSTHITVRSQPEDDEMEDKEDVKLVFGVM